jgi:hypothetical protein
MKHQKFTQIKRKIVDSTPQIVATALSAAAAVASVIYLQNLAEKNNRFPEGRRTTFTLTEDDITLLTTEDAYPVFNRDGHAFEIHYEPVEY